MQRLIRLEALSQTQQRMISGMLGAEGLCACGRLMSPLSAKFILCNAVSKHPQVPSLHGALIAAAYCYDCADRIQKFLQHLKTNQLIVAKH